MRRRFASAFFIVAIVGGVAGPVRAETQTASSFVQSLADRAIGTLRDTSAEDQRAATFKELLRDAFDLPAIGQFVLGRHWSQASADQRAAYLRTFADYVVQTYTAQLGAYAGESLRVTSERNLGDGEVVVQSRIERPSGAPIVADWRVREVDGRHRVVDVMVEGISMAVTQRSEFSSVVRREGLDGLIAAMRAKLPRDSSSS